MKLLGTEPRALKEPITPAIEPRALTPGEKLRYRGEWAVRDLRWFLDTITPEEFEGLATRLYGANQYPAISVDEWLTAMSELKGPPPL